MVLFWAPDGVVTFLAELALIHEMLVRVSTHTCDLVVPHGAFRGDVRTDFLSALAFARIHAHAGGVALHVDRTVLGSLAGLVIRAKLNCMQNRAAREWSFVHLSGEPTLDAGGDILRLNECCGARALAYDTVIRRG